MASGVTVKVKVNTKGLAMATERERRGAVKGLHAATEHVLGLSQEEVPLQEGILQGTGATDVDDAAMAGTISYDTVYAARQHQEDTWKHDPGRKSRYLEDPYLGSTRIMRDLIAASIRRELR